MAVIGVVVVTYRSAATIEACLRSLETGSSRHQVRLVVLDNASDDESALRARASAPDAVVVDRGANDGYAVANNEGLGRLGDDIDWVLFANPDTEWPPGSLDDLVAVGQARPDAGLLSPTLVDRRGQRQAIVEHDLSLWRVLRGLTRLGTVIRPAVPPSSGPPVAVEWLHTAAALLPAAVARRLGGFDARFFLFAEDADLCRRVRAIGLTVLVVPDVCVTHLGGVSVDASTDAEGAAALRVRALGTYIEKHQGRSARRIYGMVASIVYGVGGRRGRARAAWAEAKR